MNQLAEGNGTKSYLDTIISNLNEVTEEDINLSFSTLRPIGNDFQGEERIYGVTLTDQELRMFAQMEKLSRDQSDLISDNPDLSDEVKSIARGMKNEYDVLKEAFWGSIRWRMGNPQIGIGIRAENGQPMLVSFQSGGRPNRNPLAAALGEIFGQGRVMEVG